MPTEAEAREERLRAWWAEMFPRQPWIDDALDRTNYLMHEHERLSATRAADALAVLREAEPVLADMIAGRGIGGPPSWAIVIQDVIRRARSLLATGPDLR